ncbi:hypothetical protein [Paraburkholderia antibiotica]|uniref:Uncharacterized protein n=1 Tax=Paraburkholderia antibiotica TaxID=2728839 RepID=A0A7X9ZWB0_9BURK|nr:hypothetical protein [Paraburkholderia antibiotica]NML29395.1 hypothetical protein [Paraburkholderia antibiotica]
MGRGLHEASKVIRDAAINILETIHPATVRAVCYKLFTIGLIPNMAKTSTNKVSSLLTRARESGHVEWEWIVDETRRPERAQQWDNPMQIMNAAVLGYRLDYWNDQPFHVEVISEKGTVRGTIAPVLDELGVTFRVLHGYGSATTVHDIADEIRSAMKPTHLLYIGDFDPSGMHMSEVDLPDRLDRYGANGRMWPIPFEDRNYILKRIALTSDDVKHPALPGFATDSKANDPRHQWYKRMYGDQCWELDAMDPRDLRERVREEIEALIERDAWEHCMRIETVQRQSMNDFMGAVRAKFDGDSPI